MKKSICRFVKPGVRVRCKGKYIRHLEGIVKEPLPEEGEFNLYNIVELDPEWKDFKAHNPSQLMVDNIYLVIL